MPRWLMTALLSACAACSTHTKGGADAGDAAIEAASADASTGDASSPPDTSDAGTPDDTLPTSATDDFSTRAKHLLEAISKDDPDLALDTVFPRDAYIAAKDTADPGKQWDNKVLAAFKSQVHALHKKTKGIERAQFTAFEVGQPISQTVAKKHDLSRALWQVKRSRVVFTIEGKATHVEIAEMLSWRGAWYVLRMRGAGS